MVDDAVPAPRKTADQRHHVTDRAATDADKPPDQRRQRLPVGPVKVQVDASFFGRVDSGPNQDSKSKNGENQKLERAKYVTGRVWRIYRLRVRQE